MKNILEAFEKTEEKFAGKTAFVDEKKQITFGKLGQIARAVGTCLAKDSGISTGKPLVIGLPKSVESIAALLGVAYSGNFYVIMDMDMPVERMEKIFSNLSPAAVLTDSEHETVFTGMGMKTVIFEEAIKQQEDKELLLAIRRQMTETDPLYVLYTSGSTGIPKGVVVSHRNVLAYAKWFTGEFAISEETIFGNQTPFYFSMSVSDIYSTLFTGATLHILPKKLFSFPIRLLEYMKKVKINTIYWVPSALSIVANTKTLDYIELPDLKKVLFAGEVMPVKQLNIWMDHMPDILYANLFGPTETTDICAFYVVKRRFPEGASLPIGINCDNCGLLVLDEKNCIIEKGDTGREGELYVKGPFVAMGYYNNPEKTREAFVRNPVNPAYPEILYKTGDLVKYGEEGELLYNGRKDFQIKHMGYRIELGEIEAAASSLEKMDACVCIYDKETDRIVLIYQGKTDKLMVAEEMQKKVPHYMQPQEYIRIKRMPVNANGKTDRAWLNRNYKNLEE